MSNARGVVDKPYTPYMTIWVPTASNVQRHRSGERYEMCGTARGVRYGRLRRFGCSLCCRVGDLHVRRTCGVRRVGRGPTAKCMKNGRVSSSVCDVGSPDQRARSWKTGHGRLNTMSKRDFDTYQKSEIVIQDVEIVATKNETFFAHDVTFQSSHTSQLIKERKARIQEGDHISDKSRSFREGPDMKKKRVSTESARKKEKSYALLKIWAQQVPTAQSSKSRRTDRTRDARGIVKRAGECRPTRQSGGTQ
jgi:hypothetical protein